MENKWRIPHIFVVVGVGSNLRSQPTQWFYSYFLSTLFYLLLFLLLVHCKKKLACFPSPAGMSLTKLSLAGNDLETGKSLTFLQCRAYISCKVQSQSINTKILVFFIFFLHDLHMCTVLFICCSLRNKFSKFRAGELSYLMWTPFFTKALLLFDSTFRRFSNK